MKWFKKFPIYDFELGFEKQFIFEYYHSWYDGQHHAIWIGFFLYLGVVGHI